MTKTIIKHICDRCGAEIKRLPIIGTLSTKGKIYINDVQIGGIYIDDKVANFKKEREETCGIHIQYEDLTRYYKFDLCPKCTKELNEFMKGH